jgi:alkanesulfonate monooxygenase SsuD/methylene tetrahydromethanopterin reductase-like flavin-dependent oxidoreductase (luciferase family)
VHLLASLAAHGWHPAAWRVSGATGFEGVTPFRTSARLAESGGLDAVLLGLPTAPPALREKGTLDSLHLDPLPLLGALIGVTRRIGLCAYWPADVAEPYHVARVFATLDHLAAGRTGWIAGIAGPEELAKKFQRLDLPSSGPEVEARFVELIDVARQLWDSWEDESYVVDQSTGTFADSHRVHPIDHEGRFFTVRGPLNVPRPLQGQPVILYRDRSADTARAAVALSAEVILADCATMAEAQARRSEWRSLAGRQGRSADAVRLVSGVMPILGATEAEAKSRAAKLDGLVPPVGQGAPRFVGTPDQFAAWMAEWQAAGACDGFDILPAVMSFDLGAVVDHVVPALRRRGLRPAGYGGSATAATTLRGVLRLERAASRYAA